MKGGQSNRINSPLATQKHDRPGLLKLLGSLTAVAVAAALLVAAFALAPPGVEEAYATSGTHFTEEAFGVATSPPAGPNSFGSPTVDTCPVDFGDFTISQGGNPAGLCGDGVDEITTWTFDFGGPVCDGPGERLSSAVLTLDLQPFSSLFTTDTVSVGALSLGGVGSNNGWTGASPSNNFPPLVVPEHSTISRELMASPSTLAGVATFTSAQILLQGPVFSMGYQDDAIIHYARLDLTCLAPCEAGQGEVNVSTGTDGIGLPDPFWDLVTPTAPEFGIIRAPAWVLPVLGSNTNWIHQGTSPGSTSQPGSGGFPGPSAGLPYVYETSFTVPASTPDLTIDLQYAADNDVFFTLSGPSLPPVTIASMFGPPNALVHFTALHPLLGDTPRPFILPNNNPVPPGVYTISAYVYNESGPTGLLVCGTVSFARIATPVGGVVALAVSDSASPVPWTPLAAVAAGVMALLAVGGWYGRRRWLR